jgi:hypothetical protein
MIIAIVQPSFLPWCGYFEQMAVADAFVYFDDVQYTRKDWRNRNRLKSPSGIKFVSVPVRKGRDREMLVKDALINYNHPWQRESIAKITEWYRTAPYFNEIFPVFGDILNNHFEFLVDLNYSLDQAIMGVLGIRTPTYKSSDIPEKSQDRNLKIIDICKHHGADALYDGKSAKAFIQEELFERYGIKVFFQDYKYKPYPQLWGDFESHLSVLDLLMNCGPQARDILLSSPLGDKLQITRTNNS